VSKCKITVLKRMVHWDLVDEYMEPGAITRPCPHFAEGQEFIVDDHPGSDFCDAAWNDIYKAYVALAQGGSFTPWMKEDGTVVVCCSDGVRPVFFKLERISD
jgi:uncharacterized repeat protein (TIGR04076 family)